MRKFISNKITAIVLAALTVLFLGFYVYMIARPVSYGMAYTNSSVYEGETFEGRLEFSSDSTMLTKNSSFKDGFKAYYYYKNGYIFFTMAETEEEYQNEVDSIDANFEELINQPFYASEINAFRLVSVGPDGYTLTYKCNSAIVFAIVGGVVFVTLLGFSVTALALFIKAKKEN